LPLGPRPSKKLTVVAVKSSAAQYSYDPLPADSSEKPANGHAVGLLTSWKDISNYLQRGVRTTQRWERSLGLPVHRVGSGKRAPVFAFESELDGWLHKKTGSSVNDGDGAVRGNGRHASAHQHWLKRFAQDLRVAALQLEQADTRDGFEPEGRTTATLVALQTLVNAAVSRDRIGRAQVI
jgi:hypothetical protein